MSHYYENDPNLAHKDYVVEFTLFAREWRLYSDNGVFSKNNLDYGTKLLLETLAPLSLGEKILDIGCGIGTIGLLLAAQDSSYQVTLSDVNKRALLCAKRNAEALNIASRVRIVESDAFLAITAHFDTIVSNPPIRAGKEVTYRIYKEAYEHLLPHGHLYLVIRKQQGAFSALSYLKSIYSDATILVKKKGYCIIDAIKGA